MGDEEKLDRTGAYTWEPLVDEESEPTPDEYGNPSGVSRGSCDVEEGAADGSCDVEITAQIDDMFMEETKPGYGIPGFEGEESGGG